MFIHDEQSDLLGFVVSEEGMTVDLEKIKFMVEWREPTNIHVVLEFPWVNEIL